jgi:hypothetical protein
VASKTPKPWRNNYDSYPQTISHRQSFDSPGQKPLYRTFPLLKSDASQIILRMFGPISIEHGWIALTFLMNLVRVSERLHFNAVFAIAKGTHRIFRENGADFDPRVFAARSRNQQ